MDSSPTAFYKTKREMSEFLKELLDTFSKEGRPNLLQNISITWVCYPDRKPNLGSGFGTGWLNYKTIYPASVVKLIYACAIEVWLQRDLITDSKELRRAQANMIAHSSNDATSYIVDLLTGTTSGPHLEGESWEAWKKQRNLVNNWIQTLNWPELEFVNCSQKTWEDSPYGRDKKFYGEQNQNRNSLSTIAVARFLETIMTNQFLTSQASKKLKALMSRSLDLAKRKADSENQIDGFIGEGLPFGSQIWSKAGLMSEARHDAAWFQIPQGMPMLLVVFCQGEHLAKDTLLIPALAEKLSTWNP